MCVQSAHVRRCVSCPGTPAAPPAPGQARAAAASLRLLCAHEALLRRAASPQPVLALHGPGTWQLQAAPRVQIAAARCRWAALVLPAAGRLWRMRIGRACLRQAPLAGAEAWAAQVAVPSASVLVLADYKLLQGLSRLRHGPVVCLLHHWALLQAGELRWPLLCLPRPARVSVHFRSETIKGEEDPKTAAPLKRAPLEKRKLILGPSRQKRYAGASRPGTTALRSAPAWSGSAWRVLTVLKSISGLAHLPSKAAQPSPHHSVQPSSSR